MENTDYTAEYAKMIAAKQHMSNATDLMTPSKSFAEYMTSDDSIPEHVAKELKVFTDKEIALSNIQDNTQLRKIMLMFEDSVLLTKMRIPRYKRTWGHEQEISQLRAKLYIKALRSMGGALRERNLYTTLTTLSQSAAQMGAKVGGVGSRIKNMIMNKSQQAAQQGGIYG